MSSDTLRLVRAGERDHGAAQTAGMQREAGIAATTCGAENLWMGYVTLAPGVESGAHHHGDNESGIYVISGRARFRFGPNLGKSAEAGPGDFIHVPPHVVHIETNLSSTEPVLMIVARDHQEGVVVNVESDPSETEVGRRMWR
jgi:uncharacterized RmlC-like cupin family protein